MMMQVYRGEAGFQPQPVEAICAGLEQARVPFAPAFAPDRIDLIGRFAATIQKDARWRDAAPVLALAFWLRKAAVTRMAEAFRAAAYPQSIATGRGIAFHLPPQNVDTLFLYSWAIAFACGNTNVVRLPDQVSPTMTALLDPLIALLDGAGSGDLFLTYKRSDTAANERLSALADCRLVWGGDAKAELFNRLPMRMGGKSLAFSDRYSHAILSARAVAALDEAGLDGLAKGLHDDIRLFDQQACSSPHTIHLVDADAAGMAAVRRLLERLDALARRAPTTDPAHGMAKFAAACALAADDLAATATRLSNETTVVELVPAGSRGAALGGGFLSLRIAPSLAAIAETLTARDQTLTHFGLGADAFGAFAALAAARGVARLVPVGHALNFDQIWDGYDLVGELTRNRSRDRMTPPAILFVCLGNICRSPLAEAAFRARAADAGLEMRVDSAGTGGWHIGEPPDRRAQAVALRHGVDISRYRGRQVETADFHRFSHIFALDLDNLAALHRLRPIDATAKVGLLLDLVDGMEGQAVADPYYGPDAGFEITWAEVDRAAQGLLERLSRARG